jgi:hypothetical protein
MASFEIVNPCPDRSHRVSGRCRWASLSFSDAVTPLEDPLHHAQVSPKPGQMNFPRASVRNQLTRNTFGGFVTSRPMSSQC